MYELTFDEPQRHLTVNNNNNYIVLNAGSFRNDLIDAANLYFNEIKKSPQLLDKAFQRYERDGFIGWIE
jgi:hypothetical protein